MNQDLTTLVCLFHHKDHAHAALEDLLKAGVPEPNITLISDPGSRIATNIESLHELNVPDKDLGHLLDGIKAGGAVLTVSAISSLVDKVEAIFKDHRAGKIDEATIPDSMSAQALPLGAEDDDFEDEDAALGASNAVDDEQAILVTEQAIAPGVVVYRAYAIPAETTPIDTTPGDVDPRELGLDARMEPHNL